MPAPALLAAIERELTAAAPAAPPPAPSGTGPAGIAPPAGKQWVKDYETTFPGGVLDTTVWVNNRTTQGTPGNPSIEGTNIPSQQSDYSDSRNVVLSNGRCDLMYSALWPGAPGGVTYGGAHLSSYQSWLLAGYVTEIDQVFYPNGSGWPSTSWYTLQSGWGEIDNPEFTGSTTITPGGWLNVHQITNGTYGAQSIGNGTGRYYTADSKRHVSSTYWRASDGMIQTYLDGQFQQQFLLYDTTHGGYGLFFELGVQNGSGVTLGTNAANNFQIPGITLYRVTRWKAV